LGNGTLFALNTDGTGFTNLHTFTGGSDGAHPLGKLILSRNILYGTAQAGGSSSNGTVFAINTNGKGFTTLHNFSAFSTDSSDDHTNSDGSSPNGGLLLLGNILYGTCFVGGSSGLGTVFSVNVDGTAFTTLHSFSGYSPVIVTNGPTTFTNTDGDGNRPHGGLVLSGNVLYGTAYAGGNFDRGTVFSITLPTQLTTSTSGTNLVLSWPTNATGFALQSTTNPASPTWTTVSPAPVIVNGQYTVTNPISATQQFFRLSQ
jgi:uncharacterized repeat protein (TIGR03803 family)